MCENVKNYDLLISFTISGKVLEIQGAHNLAILTIRVLNFIGE